MNKLHPHEKPFPLQFLATTFGRLLLNIIHRLPYVFLPEFSRGLGVPVTSLQFWVGMRNLPSVLTPLMRWFPRTFGRRLTMVGCMILLAVTLGVFSLLPILSSFVVLLFIEVLVKITYDPEVMSHLSERSTYEQRGLVLAANETAWSGALLLGVPAAVWAMQNFNAWYAPFPFLAVLLAVGAILLGWIMPAQLAPVGGASMMRVNPLPFRKIFRNLAALCGLGIGFLMSFANEIISLTYATWLENRFAIAIAALGMSSLLIGIAELAGEGGVAWFSDRLGKRRTVLVGTIVAALAYLLLPVLGTNLNGARISLFLVYLAFEFALVSSIPLVSELVPEGRDIYISTYAAILFIGRIASIPIAQLYSQLGIWGIAGLCAAFNIVAALLLSWIPEKPTNRTDDLLEIDVF